MAAFHFSSLSSLPVSHSFSTTTTPSTSSLFNSSRIVRLQISRKTETVRASSSSSGAAAINGASGAAAINGASGAAAAEANKTSPSIKSEIGNGMEEEEEDDEVTLLSTAEEQLEEEEEEEDIDFTCDNPPLVCCFGAAQKEFVPTVRVSPRQKHPDMYSSWKGLQWDPPEFARAPGTSASNVAIAHVRLGGRAAFIGKVGADDLGKELVHKMNTEKVQTRAVKFDSNFRTGVSHLKIKFEDGKLKAETVKEAAEDSLLSSELNIAVLKEARMFHFNSEALTSPPMRSALYKAIALSKKYGGLVFFELNLPLPLWRCRDETRKLIKKAWDQADIIEVSVQELEFLLDDDYYGWRRNYRPQYYAETFYQMKNRRYNYHYTREEISPLWHDGIKFLFVTDATFRIHYYTPTFDGSVAGTEDVLITPFTCDRTGCSDAIVAAIMRKLTNQPEMFQDQDVLERQLRFVIAAGIISQWTIGAVRGFPSEGAAQNLKEQVYVPSMW